MTNVKTRKIKVSVANGGLGHADHPVAVGHYEGEIITGAEDYLNRCLGDRLKVRLQLGLCTGRLETAEVFRNIATPGRAARTSHSLPEHWRALWAEPLARYGTFCGLPPAVFDGSAFHRPRSG
jgi:hypothetical protein